MPTIELVDDDRNILTSVSIALEADGSVTVKGSEISVQASGAVRISGAAVMLG